MRHFVNYGLLFSFITLMVSGIMAFTLPFSLVTARIHIIFGALTILLVALHLISRTRYFKNTISGKKTQRRAVIIATSVWAILLVAAWMNSWPTKKFIETSYEARRQAEVVRSSPMAGFIDTSKTERFIARVPGDNKADTAISLHVRFTDEDSPPPAIAIWVETTAGTIIETLYLDSALAYSEDIKWQGEKMKRHELLPIWRHKYTMISGIDPNGEIDAFTGSTPSHSFKLENYLNSGNEEDFVLCVEVNALNDTNDTYKDSPTGQPSLLYTALIENNSDSKYNLLELTAHGGGAKESGTLNYNFDGIDSALEIIDLLLAKASTYKAAP